MLNIQSVDINETMVRRNSGFFHHWVRWQQGGKRQREVDGESVVEDEGYSQGASSVIVQPFHFLGPPYVFLYQKQRY